MRKPVRFTVLSLIISVMAASPAFAGVTKKNAAATDIVTAEEIAAQNAVSGPSFGISAEAAAEEAAAAAAPTVQELVEHGAAGQYLGEFVTTGYYNPGGNASADGSMPRAQHTVSTDWSVIPKGTRIRFEDSDIIYTVEDTGVHGEWVDVYYDTHSEAHGHGLVRKKVYLAE